MTVVVHKNEPHDVYIGRPSKWGNPFVIGRDGCREEVIMQYRHHLWEQIRSGEITIEDLRSLDGKRLACHCKPHPCHGDVIANAVHWAVVVLPLTEGMSS